MILFPCILESFRSLADKTLKVTFNTQEPTPEQVAGIAQSIGQFGYLAFKEEPFKKQEKEAIESLEADYEDSGKTPGQRMRAILYVLWKKKDEGFKSFPSYYEHKMNIFNENLKKKIDEVV